MAYKRGTLSAKDAAKVKDAVSKNTMLSAVLAGIETTDIAAANDISKSSKERLAMEESVAHSSVVSASFIIGISFVVITITGAILLARNLMGNEQEQSETKNMVVHDFMAKLDLKKDELLDHNTTAIDIVLDSDTEDIEESVDDKQPSQDEEQPVLEKSETDTRKASKEAADSSYYRVDPRLYILNYDSTEMYEKIEPLDAHRDKNKKTPVVDSVSLDSGTAHKKSTLKSIELMSKIAMSDKDKSKTASSGKLFLESSIYKSKPSEGGKSERKMPNYKGGDEALLDYFKDHLKTIEADHGTQYRKDFYLRFVIDNDGTLMHWKIIGQIAPEAKEVVKKMIEEMPQWKASEYFGKKGEVEYTFSIHLTE